MVASHQRAGAHHPVAGGHCGVAAVGRERGQGRLGVYVFSLRYCPHGLPPVHRSHHPGSPSTFHQGRRLFVETCGTRCHVAPSARLVLEVGALSSRRGSLARRRVRVCVRDGQVGMAVTCRPCHLRLPSVSTLRASPCWLVEPRGPVVGEASILFVVGRCG